MKAIKILILGSIYLLLASCGTISPFPVGGSISSPTTPALTSASATQSATAPVADKSITPEPPDRSASPRANQSSSSQPNIVFILTDDLDAAEIQYMPKLKSLIIDEGVTFRNYFVSMSLCCPSRTATLRGQYGHNTQILGNTLPSGGFEKFYQLGEEKSTIATWLQDAGYRTMLAGKYLNGYPTRDNLMYIPPGWNEWYVAMRGNAYSEFNYTLNENGKPVAYGNKSTDYGTDVYVRKSVEFMQRSANEGRPFFVYLAPYAPHAPYTPAPRHDKLFLDLKAPRTPNYNETDVSDKPNYIRNRPALNNRQINSIDEDYRKRLQSLQAVDEGIESIVSALQASGQLENTYIFFTSDNGYHLGNHRQLTGKIAPYEEELKVTMIARGPGVPVGRMLDHLVGNIDLAPTWAELAGAKTADFVDGRSLATLLRENPPSLSPPPAGTGGVAAGWRQSFAIENGQYQVIRTRASSVQPPNTDAELLEPADQDTAQFSLLSQGRQLALGVPAFRGIRGQSFSYVEYITGEKEYYDLQADPFQLENIAAKLDPKTLAHLSSRVKDLAACQASTCRTIEDLSINAK